MKQKKQKKNIEKPRLIKVVDKNEIKVKGNDNPIISGVVNGQVLYSVSSLKLHLGIDEKKLRLMFQNASFMEQVYLIMDFVITDCKMKDVLGQMKIEGEKSEGYRTFLKSRNLWCIIRKEESNENDTWVHGAILLLIAARVSKKHYEKMVSLIDISCVGSDYDQSIVRMVLDDISQNINLDYNFVNYGKEIDGFDAAVLIEKIKSKKGIDTSFLSKLISFNIANGLMPRNSFDKLLSTIEHLKPCH